MLEISNTKGSKETVNVAQNIWGSFFFRFWFTHLKFGTIELRTVRIKRLKAMIHITDSSALSFQGDA
jgi:hypothetical protein